MTTGKGNGEGNGDDEVGEVEGDQDRRELTRENLKRTLAAREKNWEDQESEAGKIGKEKVEDENFEKVKPESLQMIFSCQSVQKRSGCSE